MKMIINVCFVLVCCTFGFVIGLMKSELNQEELNAIVRPKTRRSEEKNANLTMKEKPNDCEATISCNYVKFYLYTNSNPTSPQELKNNDLELLQKSYFNSKNPTRFITHGWIETSNSRSCWSIRDAYLKLNGSKDNVIIVDWSKVSLKPYERSVDKVNIVSRELSNMIEFMVEKGNLNVSDATLVGYSLGAHVVGIAGYFSKYKVRHVIGLDPAILLFNFAPPEKSLSKLSGQHVQIIHTNAGAMGYLSSSGHSDFYPNGGVEQPGCCDSWVPGWCTFCSHSRSVELFAESISMPFNGVQCDNWQEYPNGSCSTKTTLMGGPSVDIPEPGTYFFATRSSPPYSITQ